MDAAENKTTPEGKDLAPAVQIAERTACQQERSEEERVGLDHPLNVGNGRVQGRLKAGSATLTTVLSMKAMLEPRIVAASTHLPLLPEVLLGSPARIAASSQGDLAMFGMEAFEGELRGMIYHIQMRDGPRGRKPMLLHAKWTKLFDTHLPRVVSSSKAQFCQARNYR